MSNKWECRHGLADCLICNEQGIDYKDPSPALSFLHGLQNNKCPSCHSNNVEAGNIPLRCLDCGWHYCHKHPCEVCGEPSESYVGGSGMETKYRCPKHPISWEEIRVAFGWSIQEATMTRSFAEFAVSTPDTDIPLLRELLSIDMRIPESTKFSRGQCGSLSFEMAPGPLHWSRQVEWPWVLRNGDFRPEQRVLEVGGSYTCLQYYLMQLRAVVTNIDLDYEALEAAGRNCWHFEDDRTERIRHEKMDARELRWKSSFDRVICVSTIEHIESREGRAKAIDEIVRVLKPGGLLLLTFDVFLKPEESELGECEMHAILERLGIDPATLAGQQVHVGSVDGRDVLVCMVKYCKEDK